MAVVTKIRLKKQKTPLLFQGGVAAASADGVVLSRDTHSPHIIASAIEHPSVQNVCEDLEKQCCELTYLPVYENGIVRIEDVKEAIRDDTVLISIMTANNEIGTLQPVQEIGQFVKELRN